jgi:hypothetical protein
MQQSARPKADLTLDGLIGLIRIGLKDNLIGPKAVAKQHQRTPYDRPAQKQAHVTQHQF